MRYKMKLITSSVYLTLHFISLNVITIGVFNSKIDSSKSKCTRLSCPKHLSYVRTTKCDHDGMRVSVIGRLFRLITNLGFSIKDNHYTLVG